MIVRTPKFVYLIPTFGNPSGALLSLERRRKILELAVKYQVLIVEDDPYGDLYFGEPPPQHPGPEQGRPRQLRMDRPLRSLSKVLSPACAWLADRSPSCWRRRRCASSSATRIPAAVARDGGAIPEERADAGHAEARARGLCGSARIDGGEDAEARAGDAIEFTEPQGGLFFWRG